MHMKNYKQKNEIQMYLVFIIRLRIYVILAKSYMAFLCGKMQESPLICCRLN